MKLTERHTFKTDIKQKQTLSVLRDKYRINTSEFIRAAILEKLERDKGAIFKNHKEIQSYLKQREYCPY